MNFTFCVDLSLSSRHGITCIHFTCTAKLWSCALLTVQ